MDLLPHIPHNAHFAPVVSLLLNITTFANFVTQSLDHYIEDKDPVDEYDYIVIGAGGAGSVVANRLSEDSNIKVLLLEAGGHDNILTDIPFMAPAAQLTKLDWMYRTTPQEKGNLGLCDHVGPVPRGKVLGGSSTLHYMMYVRGNKRDYEDWDKKLGIKGWSYEENLPFFKKSEGLQGEMPYEETKPLHNRKGTFSVNFLGMEQQLAKDFIDAGKEIGYDEVDYNGPKQLGFSYVQASTRDGQRCSSAKAFLKGIKDRPNLTISMNSFVTKILINSDKEAYGVEYEKKGATKTVKATKEVILSAGAYSSPQILMLSGVGPEDELNKHGITVIHNLPGVGQNMQDHVSAAAVIYEIDQSHVPDPTPEQFVAGVESYVKSGTGFLAQPVGLLGVAFVNTKFNDAEDKDFADIQLVYLVMPSVAINATKDLYNICDPVWTDYFKPLVDKNHVVMYPMIMRPRSKGELKLKSSNPHDLPLINPKLFTDAENHDLKVLGDGIKMSVNLTTTEAFKKSGIKFPKTVMPGCEGLDQDSDEYYQCLAKGTTITFYHTVATCIMGPASNSMAVVDERLRVHGIKKLRVADASVIPIEITGNVNGPTVMVGERAAAFIKEDNA